MCKCMQTDLCDKIHLKKGNSPQKNINEIQKQPSRSVLKKGVLKINRKLTGDHENTPKEVQFH